MALADARNGRTTAASAAHPPRPAQPLGLLLRAALRRSEPEDPSISPSGISMKGKPVRGLEPMTLEQIGAVQDEYVATAQRCADVGFDGIAIHSAHGYRTLL